MTKNVDSPETIENFTPTHAGKKIDQIPAY